MRQRETAGRRARQARSPRPGDVPTAGRRARQAKRPSPGDVPGPPAGAAPQVEAVFAYGTLRGDYSDTGDRWGLLKETGGSWRRGRVRGFRLHQVSGYFYPFAFHSGNPDDLIEGTLLTWPSKGAALQAIERCDAIEGYDPERPETGLYLRAEVEVEALPGERARRGAVPDPVTAYIYHQPMDSRDHVRYFPDGDWLHGAWRTLGEAAAEPSASPRAASPEARGKHRAPVVEIDTDVGDTSEQQAAPTASRLPDEREAEARGNDRACEIKVETDWGEMLDDLAMPTSCRQPDERELYLIENALTASECAALIAASEGHGFGGTDYPKDYRGNLRLITTDASLSEAMWERLRPFVPATVTIRKRVFDAVGLNECWRLAKYHPGDHFSRHCDATFSRSDREHSMFTVNIYMNGDFEGGATRFYAGESGEHNLVVTPEAGLCLVFRQPPEAYYTHDGEEVRSGTKYLFRSDVMYRRRRRDPH